MDFSLSRLWLLLRKIWLENQRLYLLSLGAIAGTITILAYFILQSNLAPSQSNTLILAMIPFGAVLSSTLMKEFTDPFKKKQTLMLPATALEKLSSALVYSILIFPLAFLLVAYPLFWLVNWIDAEYFGGPDILLHTGASFLRMYPAFLFFNRLCCCLVSSSNATPW